MANFRNTKTPKWIQCALVIGAVSLPLTTDASTLKGTWSGEMRCGKGSEQMVSGRQFKITGRVISYSQGEEGFDGYEIISGAVDPDGTVLLQGTYQWDSLKGIWFYGQIEKNVLKATGWRGRNWCTLELDKTSHMTSNKAGV